MKRTHAKAVSAILVAVGIMAATVSQAGLGVTYVKTLGQANVTGQPLKGAGFRQVAVDAEGNLYLAVVRGWPWTSVAKISPQGRVIWESECGGYSTVSLMVAGDSLYALNSGLLRRFRLASGVMDPEWGHVWDGGKKESRGVRKFAAPVAMLAAGPYLFVVDKTAHELRRLDLQTAVEKPFKMRVMVVEPLDLALAKNGNPLVLTSESVLEINPDGQPLRVPLIAGLPGAQALDVDPRTGQIHVAVGGQAGQLANQIWQYDAEGKATGVKLGRGGDFNGQWTPDTFAFASGNADFALDGQGGLWVNTALGPLVHFKGGAAFTADRTLLSLGMNASGIAVDDQLNVCVGVNVGGLRLSWDNQVIWTCGLQHSGDRQRFPSSPVGGWPVYAVCAGAKIPVFYSLHDGTAWSVSPVSGELAGTRGGPGQSCGGLFLRATDDSLYMKTGNSGQITQGTAGSLADWKTWKQFLELPADLKAAQLVGVSRDQARVYVHDGKSMICVGRDGKRVWELAAPPCGYVFPAAFLRDDVMFLNLAGKATALDARSGEKLAEIGKDAAADGRPALDGGAGFAVGSKDGKDYLFVLANCQVQVFEIASAAGAQ